MRRLLLVWPAACLLIVALTLYMRRDQLRQLPGPGFPQPHQGVNVKPPTFPPQTSSAAPTRVTASSTKPHPAPTAGNSHGALSSEMRAAYVNAIMDAGFEDLPRLECPTLDASRYQHLQLEGDGDTSDSLIRYFFAIDLRQCVALLPRLMGSVVEAIRFLGPRHCALSVVEGNSDDGTGEVLAALRPELEALGVTYYFRTSDVNPKKGDRIVGLAKLRNLALQPMLDGGASPSPRYSPNATTVVFLNDIAICPEDILELVHQRALLGADMTCGMDWTYVGRDPTFYDVWVARDMAGESFFRIPPDGSWDFAWDLFWSNRDAKARFAAQKPFQVFSCWNGAAVFSAAPLLAGGVRFRSAREGECFQGEPQLFCKDLWFRGYGKIAVVPAVNLEYSDEAGRKIKDAKGYTSRWVGAPDWRDEAIAWQAEPPERVKCMSSYKNQYFEAWNQSQPEI